MVLPDYRLLGVLAGAGAPELDVCLSCGTLHKGTAAKCTHWRSPDRINVGALIEHACRLLSGGG